MSFDRLARHYRWMEWALAGEKLQRCRTLFLDRIREPKRILIAGEGNGRFLSVCAPRFPRAEITVADQSAGMLKQARARQNSSRICFVQADARDWRGPEAAFDLVVTHFFLDCFPEDELQRVIENLAFSAGPEASWLLADFQIPERGLARARAAMIHKLMYGFFRLATKLPARKLVSPDRLLGAKGFMLAERSEKDWGLLRSDLWIRTAHFPNSKR